MRFEKIINYLFMFFQFPLKKTNRNFRNLPIQVESDIFMQEKLSLDRKFIPYACQLKEALRSRTNPIYLLANLHLKVFHKPYSFLIFPIYTFIDIFEY